MADGTARRVGPNEAIPSPASTGLNDGPTPLAPSVYSLDIVRRAWICIVSMVIAACSSAGSEGQPTAGRGVDAGSTAATDSSVVAIVSPNGDPTYVCSAEVIGPRTILSAGHCFKGGNYDKTGWSFEVFLGNDDHAPASSDRRVRITSFRLHPDYLADIPRADGSDADIAVAFVDEDLGVTPLPFNATSLPAHLEGTSGRYVGFGSNAVSEKGIRHAEAARIVDVSPLVVSMTAGRIPCHGDSGGPLFLSLGGVETIVGIGHTSNVDDGGNCVVGADYTRTDLFADFVNAALN
ncbi:MAG: peptidase (chymotrypsin) family [Myxococcaceae bacterium]|nr:peptidase (chymotrypsin) family [Myxococcaceae bacterium]